jgi:hypothetical protein
LIDNVKKFLVSPEHVIDQNWFREIGRWLQYMVLLNSANRLQVVECLENRHIGEFFNVLFEQSVEQARKKVKLVRSKLFDSEHFAVVVPGGKTGKMEVSVPLDLAIGLTNYYLIKKNLGIVNQKTGNCPLFTDITGKPMSAKGLYSTKMYTEVCNLMGVKAFKSTQIRHVMSTDQIDNNAEGEPGTDHSR